MPIASRDALRSGRKPSAARIYELPRFGNVHCLHFTDCHAQLLPIYFREPSVNLGVGAAFGSAAASGRRASAEALQIARDTPQAHAFTYLDFAQAARTYGKVGGFAHLSTLVKRLKASRPGALLLDGGDSWQGSATALWTDAQDMVDASKLLGVDVMTAHWEMTYGAQARAGDRRQGLERAHRLHRSEHQDHRLRRSGVSAVHDERNERRQHWHHRPGVSVHADRQSALLRSRLELRHPGREHAEDGRRSARQRSASRRRAVA